MDAETTDIVSQARHTYDERSGVARPFRPTFAGAPRSVEVTE